jgi:hypothetical protein
MRKIMLSVLGICACTTLSLYAAKNDNLCPKCKSKAQVADDDDDGGEDPLPTIPHPGPGKKNQGYGNDIEEEADIQEPEEPADDDLEDPHPTIPRPGKNQDY